MAQLALTNTMEKGSILAFADGYPAVVRTYFDWNYEQSLLYVSQRAARAMWRKIHVCVISITLCVDERLSDILLMLGLLPGLPDISRSPGSLESSIAYPITQKRKYAFHEEYCSDGEHIEVHLETYHFSGSSENGCAARKNDTCAYKRDAIEYAKRLNRALDRSIISFAVGVDTDDDSLTVHGTNGDLSVGEYVDREDVSRDVLISRLAEHLERIFPSERGLLNRKSPRMIQAFYTEFAELLANNVEYVRIRRKQLAVTGPEKEAHTALLTFIGRPLDMEPPKGSTFLLEDGDPRYMADYVGIPLKYVCKNALQRAAQTGNEDDFVIPFVISVPHRGGNIGLKREAALDIAAMVHDTAQKRLGSIISKFERTLWWGELPEKLRIVACSRGVMDRVQTYPCVHDQQVRLFTPVTL